MQKIYNQMAEDCAIMGGALPFFLRCSNIFSICSGSMIKARPGEKPKRKLSIIYIH